MAIILRRQISDDEKKTILSKFNNECYATGHSLNDSADIHFDHIKAYADKGVSEIGNIAPMCREHNLKKGALPLEDFRIRLKIEEFFGHGQSLTLKDELKYLEEKHSITGFGKHCYSKIHGNEIETEIENKKETHRLFTCPTTEWQYFYAVIPVTAINSDDDENGEIGLQPRYLIFDKVFNLYRHFQKHPVLQPSVARLCQDKILVFDGQHKIAAMLWADRKDFELKVYIDPDPQTLNTTNIAAHDKFAQTRFYSSVMVEKLGSQFGKKFEDYKNREGEPKKSEAGFVEYLRQSEELTKGDVNKRFTSFLYNMVLAKEQNKIAILVSKGNRSSADYPLTTDMLSKSIFSNFLYRDPLEEDMASIHYKREIEISNVIRLCNILHEEALHSWDAKGSGDNSNQNKLSRICRSKSMMSWAEILKDAISAKLDIHDSDDKAMIFHRELTPDEFDTIRAIVRRFIDWSVWSSPHASDIDRILADNKHEVKKYMKDKGLTPGYLMGASE